MIYLKHIIHIFPSKPFGPTYVWKFEIYAAYYLILILVLVRRWGYDYDKNENNNIYCLIEGCKISRKEYPLGCTLIRLHLRLRDKANQFHRLF